MNRRGALAVAGLLALVAVAVLFVRGTSGPRYDYKPVVRGSALDGWRAPWRVDPAPVDASTAAPVLPRKWIVMGWDGASWEILLPLIEAGRLPQLASLMRNGSYGSLLTFRPTQSAVVWTTVATGVSPRRHGILGFSKPTAGVSSALDRILGRKERRTELFSNADRRVKALWNVASENGKSVLVVGYHNTFPVEKVTGLMVSNYLVRQSMMTFVRGARHEGGDAAGHLVYPPQATKTVAGLSQRLEDVTWDEVARFASIDPGRFRTPWERTKRGPRGDQRWEYLVKAYAYDAFHGRVAAALRAEAHPDFLMLHFQCPDWAGHYFLYFHDPQRYAGLPGAGELHTKLDRDLPAYRGTVAAFYEYADEWLGKLLEGADEQTGVMVLSDHGMDPLDNASEPGDHNDAPPGVVILSGPGIKPNNRIEGATIYDILPTLLASAGLPVARDLEGKILEDAFVPGALSKDRVTMVASYQSGGERYQPQVELGAELHGEVERELRGLGYIQ
jgi:predicted AlkP superfamily pyrophosphatase or phosphodiesterase